MLVDMVFVPRTFRKGEQTEVADDPTEEAILLYDGWLPDEGAPPPAADPNRHVTVAELSTLPELAIMAVAALEDAPAVAPAGIWNFAQAPMVAGVELGGVDQAYVDAIGTNLANPNTIVRRDAGGNTAAIGFWIAGAQQPEGEWATRKDYVDAGDTAAKDRVNHIGTQASATIADLTEAVQDIVGAFLRAGTGTTVTYDDALGTFTINATASGGTTDPEIVRDVIGTAMVAGAGIQITVNDAGDTITVASTAVLPTRQVISGTGLTGGGDLSADRTLAVTYGTTAGTAAQGNDSRLSDARTPLAHTHTATDISNSTAVGRSVLTAADGAAVRTAAGAAARAVSIRTITAADSLTLADASDVLINSTAAAAIAFAFPSDATAAIPIGSSGTVRQGGAGVITATAGAGATLQARGNALKTAGLYASFVWTKVAANTFDISGDVTT